MPIDEGLRAIVCTSFDNIMMSFIAILGVMFKIGNANATKHRASALFLFFFNYYYLQLTYISTYTNTLLNRYTTNRKREKW